MEQSIVINVNTLIGAMVVNSDVADQKTVDQVSEKVFEKLNNLIAGAKLTLLDHPELEKDNHTNKTSFKEAIDESCADIIRRTNRLQ